LLAIAAFGLVLRIRQHGFTPDRIEGLAAVLLGAVYAHGYGWAAVRAHPWMKHLQGTNVFAAHVALALLLAIFSPLADPARLSVNDQMHRLRTGKVSVQDFDYNFLRHASGLQGRKALDELADHPFGPNAAEMAERAKNARKAVNPWTPVVATAADQLKYTTIVGSKSLPASFTSQSWPEATDPLRVCSKADPCTAVLRDFDLDGQMEVLIVSNFSKDLYALNGKTWVLEGHIGDGCENSVLDGLRSGVFDLQPPRKVWRDVIVAGKRISVIPATPCVGFQKVVIDEDL